MKEVERSNEEIAKTAVGCPFCMNLVDTYCNNCLTEYQRLMIALSDKDSIISELREENNKLKAVEQDWLQHDCGLLLEENKRLNAIQPIIEALKNGAQKGTITIDREAFKLLYSEEISSLKAKILRLETAMIKNQEIDKKLNEIYHPCEHLNVPGCATGPCDECFQARIKLALTVAYQKGVDDSASDVK